MIRAIEEHSLNAWPSLQTLLYDGWLLRFAGGYTRRANSVNPLYPSINPPADNIAACEAVYRARGLPVVFKITPASLPAGLDDLLERCGYRLDAPTSVQTLDLTKKLGSPSAAVELEPTLSKTWLAAFSRITSADPARQAIHRQLLQSILPACAYASVSVSGQIVACGLGVVQGGLLGLYDIATHPDHRRQGYAASIMLCLLDWGRRTQARIAYLQVMLNNPPALRLYARLGFRELYQYHYRVKS